MAFRRQDIPKTTRKAEDGGHRRLYPRYARDRALLPKVELAIGYLDGMVGRKRGDLSPDVVLELFGDPKLARCILTCLADHYRYRTPEIAEVVGEPAALALAAWDLLTPADLRGHVYLAANAEHGHGGFVPDEARAAFLAAVARPLGLDARQLDELLHLDAERNAILIRVGPRPTAEDVLARYNTFLTLSVLGHASEITLELPGLTASTVETVCSRHEVAWRREAAETIRLSGRRSATGSWVRFGARLARCALQLVALCPRTPSGRATIHLGDQTLAFVLDAKVVATLRPKLRAVAGADGVIQGAVLADAVGALRRKVAGGAHGWMLRRLPPPVVVDGALALPEVQLTRDTAAVAVVPVAGGDGRSSTLAALALAAPARPVVAMGQAAEGSDLPALATPDAAVLVALLDRLSGELDEPRTPLTEIADELAVTGWVSLARLDEVFGAEEDHAARVRPLTAEGEAVLVPGFGLCRLSLLDELLDRLVAGPLDVAAFRNAVAARVGDGPGADALTLHLLSRQAFVAQLRAPAADGQQHERAA